MCQEQEDDTQNKAALSTSLKRAFSTSVASESSFLLFRKRIPKFPQAFFFVLVVSWRSAVEAHVMPTNASSFLNYNHFSGNQLACWNATTSQQIDNATVDPAFFLRPIEFTTQQCGGTTELRMDILEAPTFPLGWEVRPGQTIQVDIEGYWTTINSTIRTTSSWDAALVIQLCPVGIGSICPPILPIPPSPATRRLALDQITLTDYLMDFEYFSITNGKQFIKQGLVLRPEIPGIYSILASFVVFPKDPGDSAQAAQLNNSHTALGASAIPISSLGRELFIVVQAAFDDGGTPAVVEDWAVLIVFCFCGIGGFTLFALLAFSVYYRNAQVFELTQGKFLMAMLLSGLVATCSLFLMEPKNDTYCRLFYPLVTLPTHIMFAILVGRMWRIRAIISPLLLVTLDKEEHWTSKCVNMVEKLTRYEWFGNRVKVSGKKLRRAITDRQLLTVIVFLCLPQILVQILIATISNQGFEIDYDSKFFPDGYATCTLRFFDNFLGTAAFALVLVLFLILLVLTGSSRDLPSLFNETQSIWTIAVVAFRMTVVGTIVLALTYTQPSGPTTQYLILSLVGGVTIVHTCVRITWAKVETARNGSTITVTKLIAAHNRSRVSQDTASIQPSVDALGSPLFNTSLRGRFMPSRLSSKSKNRLDPASSADGKETLNPGGRDAGVNLSTLQEEEETACQISMLHNVQEGQDSLPTLYAPEDNHDANSTDSSVVVTMVDDFDYFSSRADADYGQTSETLPLPSEITSPENFLAVFRTSDLTVGYPTSGNNTNASHRTIFGRQASRSTINSLDIDASVLPPFAVTQSDGVVPSLVFQDDLRPRLPVRNRLRSQRRFVHFGLQDHRNDPMRSSDPISGSTVFHRNATLIPLTIEYNPRNKSDVILVDKGVPPPRRLLLRMIDVQRRLARANNAILSGLGLDTTEWEEIRDACSALGEVFVSYVQFDWESEQITHTERPVADAYAGMIREDGGSSTLRQSSSLFEEVPKSSRESLINDDPEWPEVLVRTPQRMMELPVGVAKDDSADGYISDAMKG